MRTVRRPLSTLLLVSGLALGAAGCDSGTNPDAPAEIEESIQESGPEVVETNSEGDQGLNQGATEGASTSETEGGTSG